MIGRRATGHCKSTSAANRSLIARLTKSDCFCLTDTGLGIQAWDEAHALGGLYLNSTNIQFYLPIDLARDPIVACHTATSVRRVACVGPRSSVEQGSQGGELQWTSTHLPTGCPPCFRLHSTELQLTHSVQPESRGRQCWSEAKQFGFELSDCILLYQAC